MSNCPDAGGGGGGGGERWGWVLVVEVGSVVTSRGGNRGHRWRWEASSPAVVGAPLSLLLTVI